MRVWVPSCHHHQGTARLAATPGTGSTHAGFSRSLNVGTAQPGAGGLAGLHEEGGGVCRLGTPTR